MANLRNRLVLASKSPRRSEILERLGLPCEVRPSRVQEAGRPGEEPAALALRLARDKATEVGARTGTLGAVVLAADTVVVVDGRALGKPADHAHATAMLRALSGRWHEVVTAVVLLRAPDVTLEATTVATAVRFRGLSEDTIARYVASGEGRDKAGAYAIQGLGAGLVSEVRGSYDNVVGLPAAEVIEMLERHGVLEEWP